MATKKRKSSKRKTVRHTAARKVATKTRRHTAKRRSTKRRVYASRRNPVNLTKRRKRYSRRGFFRNPLGGGGEVIDFAGGGLLLGLAKPFADRFFGQYAAQLGQFGAPVLTAFTGWGLSKLLEMFGFTRRFAKPARILGYSTAVIQVVQPIVGRALAGVNGGNGMGRRRGVYGIGIYPGVPEGIPMMPPAPPNAQGMNGMGVYPGVPAGIPR